MELFSESNLTSQSVLRSKVLFPQVGWCGGRSASIRDLKVLGRRDPRQLLSIQQFMDGLTMSSSSNPPLLSHPNDLNQSPLSPAASLHRIATCTNLFPTTHRSIRSQPSGSLV